jgi:hypothetical protein
LLIYRTIIQHKINGECVFLTKLIKMKYSVDFVIHNSKKCFITLTLKTLNSNYPFSLFYLTRWFQTVHGFATNLITTGIVFTIVPI